MISDPEKGNSPVSPRRAARDSLLLMTNLQSPVGKLLGAARIRNLSATGMMADCVSRLKDGEAVMMEIRGIGTVSGTVTWSDGKKIGVAFDTQIDPRLARKPVGKVKP